MFPEMRRKDRELAAEEPVPILERAEYGILSTYDVNGYPYGVPINYVLSDGEICFHCAINAGVKVANMRKHPKVCFTVVVDTQVLPEQFSTKYKSVIVFGTVRELESDAKRQALKKLIDKYSPDFQDAGAKYIDAMWEKTAVFAIHSDHMTGKGRKN